MDFEYGIRYEAPSDADGASWFAKALDRVRQHRVGDVPVAFELNHGPPVVGMLDQVKGEPSPGIVRLEQRFENLEVSCDAIVAFLLINNEPPIDHSDELRI